MRVSKQKTLTVTTNQIQWTTPNWLHLLVGLEEKFKMGFEGSVRKAKPITCLWSSASEFQVNRLADAMQKPVHQHMYRQTKTIQTKNVLLSKCNKTILMH